MGWVTQSFEKRQKPGPLDDYWYISKGEATAAGIDINPDVALTFSTVWACISRLAGTAGILPLILYERLEADAKRRATRHPVFKLLKTSPNRKLFLSPKQLKQIMVVQMCLWGNAYFYVERDLTGPKALWPMDPSRTEVKFKEETNVPYYEYHLYKGGTLTYEADEILHPRLFSAGGLKGYSIISQARESIGLAMASQEYGARLFGTGAQYSGVLTAPKALSKEGREHIEDAIKRKHGGVKNAWKVILLEEDIKWQQVGMPAHDAEWLEGRKFQRVEIASWFGMQPHMIGDLTHATFTNIEHQGLEYVTYTSMPLLKEIEEESSLKLLRDDEREDYFAEFLVAGLLRGDQKTRYDAYAVGRQWGWFSVNDILRLENMNPIGPEGDIRLSPLNMIPADKAQDVTPGQVQAPARAMAFREWTGRSAIA